MKKFIEPDYTRSNLNISATLTEFLGAPNRLPILPSVSAELKRNYKNIVFICFDGLGIHPLEMNLPESDFLRQNITQTLLSTFPSTTTNATKSLLFNKYPLEHGWFGWSMHFKELNTNVDIFLNKDSITKEDILVSKSPLGNFDYYFDMANSDYSVNTVFPPYVVIAHPERNTAINTLEELSLAVKSICSREGKQFIYAYLGEPDSTMHFDGVSGTETTLIFKSISDTVKDLYDSLDNTLLIITADHGQVDIEGYVEFYNDRELISMFKVPPYMETRAPAFIVKDGYAEDFEKHFKGHYSDDFVLYRSEELVKKGYFGEWGDKAHLLGDYIAIGTYTHKQALFSPLQTRYKGHHTSLTEEMEVPLIMLGKNNKLINRTFL